MPNNQNKVVMGGNEGRHSRKRETRCKKPSQDIIMSINICLLSPNTVPSLDTLLMFAPVNLQPKACNCGPAVVVHRATGHYVYICEEGGQES